MIPSTSTSGHYIIPTSVPYEKPSVSPSPGPTPSRLPSLAPSKEPYDKTYPTHFSPSSILLSETEATPFKRTKNNYPIPTDTPIVYSVLSTKSIDTYSASPTTCTSQVTIVNYIIY